MNLIQFIIPAKPNNRAPKSKRETRFKIYPPLWAVVAAT